MKQFISFLILFYLISSAYSQTVINLNKSKYYYPNPLSFWDFNESSGNAIDQVNSYVLTNNNSATYSAGIDSVNNAINFGLSNTNKYLSNTSSFGLTYQNDLTIGFEFKLNSLPTTTYAIAGFMFATNPGGYISLWTNNTNKLVINGTGINVSYTLSVNKWYQVVIQYSYINNYTKLYINGALIASGTKFTTQDATSFQNGITIAQIANVYYSNVAVDNFGIWSGIIPDSYYYNYTRKNDFNNIANFNTSRVWLTSTDTYYDSTANKTYLAMTQDSSHSLIEVDNSKGVTKNYLLDKNLSPDDHRSFAVTKLDDNKFITAFTANPGQGASIRISSFPNNIDYFNSKINVNESLVSYYPVIFNCGNGKIYIFYSYNEVNNCVKGYIKSLDSGATWSLNSKWADNSTFWYYTLYFQDKINKNKIHIIQCAHPTERRATNKIGYYYFDATDETFRKIDGTNISSQLPFNFNSGDLVTSTTDPNQLWIEDISTGPGNYPRILYSNYPNMSNPSQKQLIYTEWNGSAWTTPYQIFDSMNKNIGQIAEVAVYSPGSYFNKINSDVIVAGKQVGPNGRIELMSITRNSYNNFTITQLTSGSKYDQWRPIIVNAPKYNVFSLNKYKYVTYSDCIEDLKVYSR